MWAVACRIFLYFLLYSFAGWTCETVWCSVGERKFAERGFLAGPICPIYGFGALAVIYLLKPYTENWFTVFLAGLVVTSFLEYVTGWALETLFHLKLWDYSKRFCNLNGRICLRNSVLFGLMSVLLVWIIHPWVVKGISYIPNDWLAGISLPLFALFLADCVISIRNVLQLNGKLEKLHQAAEEWKEKNEALRQTLQQNVEGRLESARQQREERAQAARARIEQLNARMEELQTQIKRKQRRILRAFPDMTSKRHPDLLEQLKQNMEKKKRAKKEK